jgi:RNA polymerase sigma-70 factor, ECF subfamily
MIRAMVRMTISPAKSPCFCGTGAKATRRLCAPSCPWFTRSCVASLIINYLRSERPDHTLQSTELVHEAYLRLAGGDATPRNRAHFIAVASRLMRQILVDYARARAASKRDGGCRIALENVDVMPVRGDAELLALDLALDDLSHIDERQGKIVEMKFFGGLSAPEIAEVLQISRATVDRDWAVARVWLHRQMSRTAET